MKLTSLVKQIIERPLTSKEKRSKEKIVKGLKGRKDLDKSDKYAIATAQAKKMDEANLPINTPRDLIDNDILDIPDGDMGEIKKSAAKLGIDPQNKFESELRDEIEDLLTSPMSTYEEYELVKKYFGDYADELIHQYGLKIDEMTDDEFEKAKEADRLAKHPERDKIIKIQKMMGKEKEHPHDLPPIDKALQERLQKIAGIIK